ncbi:DNA cytosine methyltransferase [Nodularia sphaerocarpa]|uniref:DNA cytosine methyltransferase n=1 Tax=Nodularia sphaerocarpa TaxID=137816 RepID=UPI001EFAA99C|nr:DNA cytosine methyltransferase [Nodularia sphaerocarpa]MDB9372502.1 DNA cytosine methyltransferase [Nodularia sphaerocarpa CS-585]MDB9377306.1 DNA cytosine methyltransferase [Nodularia sphaerocarpa CS-585A2]ULP71278.1 Modification methylase BspRI [Nodularia sphaerocarpa UHCC 0038]
MQGTQLDLFPHEDERNPIKKQKQPKLGRYQRIQRELDKDNSDSYKKFIDISSPPNLLSKYTFVDLFCGAGGITQGLSQAGFTPLASVEISPIASATHKKNFPKCHHFCGDIEQFSAQDWLQQIGSPEVNVVVGGPPCQGFSVAGKRDPKDPRNRLFYEFVRVVSEIRPWYVVMENVPGILTIQKGSVKTAIIEAFKAIGYPHISVAILESAAYGVPQIRPRAIFIANRFGMPNPYPKSQLSVEEYKPIESAISDLPEYTPIPEINHEWTKHSPEYMERLAQVPPGGSLYKKFLDAFKRQYTGKPSMTVKENHGGTHIHPYLNRVISAREMARLQTFPDSFIFEGTMKKAMWQIGNAVPPRLAECIGYALIPYLNDIAVNPQNLVKASIIEQID